MFTPLDVGIEPKSIFTACHKGFWCEYKIEEGLLYVESFYVYSKNNVYPAVNGINVEPLKDKFQYMGHQKYSNVNIRLSFTGEVAVHYGKVIKWVDIRKDDKNDTIPVYEENLVFVFQKGYITDVIDMLPKICEWERIRNKRKEEIHRLIREDVERRKKQT